jgi:MerR family transcriptional regulator, thiopeptide resistance regulator
LTRLARNQGLLSAIENEMEARQMGISLTPEEQFELFGPDFAEHQKEAEERWGDSAAFKESQRRAAAYSKDDWLEIKREADENIEAFAAALKAGQPATSALAMDLAEAHREHISRWFYECGYAQHRGLAALYVSDPRFTAPYDKVAPGFSQYVHDAIMANAERAEAAD